MMKVEKIAKERGGREDTEREQERKNEEKRGR